MDTTKHSAYHLDMLNEIHANRAVRHLTNGRVFKHSELIAIAKSVGDLPVWDKDEQHRLVTGTLSAMAIADPYVGE